MPALGPGSQPVAASPTARPRLPRGAAFWLVGATVVALLAASSAPSPLYPVYQQEFGFSPIELTTIFAVYVLALLLSLLTVGRLSDFVGRRPVLAAALVVEAAAMVVFLVADGSASLLAARVVQGLATGAAIGVLGAYLLDLQPGAGSRLGSLVNSAAPAVGLGVGALGTGLLVQYGPHPTRLVFALFTAVFAVLAAATAVLPETVRRVPGAVAALRPRAAVPAPARRAFLAATPTMVATWALGGLMLSVGGSLVRTVFGAPNSAVVGLVLGIFAGSGAVAAVLVSSLPPGLMERLGGGRPGRRHRPVPDRAGRVLAGPVRGRGRGRRQRLRGGLPGRAALGHPAGPAARAGRAAVRGLRGQLPGLQRPRAGGRGADHPPRPARHRLLLRRAGRPGRVDQPGHRGCWRPGRGRWPRPPAPPSCSRSADRRRHTGQGTTLEW